MDWVETRDGRSFALCRCGYGMSFDNIDGFEPVKPHVSQYGFYFAKEARRLADSGLSLRAIASALSIGTSTANRLVKQDPGGPDCVAVDSCRDRLGREWAVLVHETGGAKAAGATNPILYNALVRFAPDYLTGGRGRRVKTCP